MFSGGSYEEVARWLRNFLTSHAKRENPRAEVELEADARAGKSYGARVRLGERVSTLIVLEYADVAKHRGNLQWCAGLAARAREVVRDVSPAAA